MDRLDRFSIKNNTFFRQRVTIDEKWGELKKDTNFIEAVRLICIVAGLQNFTKLIIMSYEYDILKTPTFNLKDCCFRSHELYELLQEKYGYIFEHKGIIKTELYLCKNIAKMLYKKCQLGIDGTLESKVYKVIDLLTKTFGEYFFKVEQLTEPMEKVLPVTFKKINGYSAQWEELKNDKNFANMVRLLIQGQERGAKLTDLILKYKSLHLANVCEGWILWVLIKTCSHLFEKIDNGITNTTYYYLKSNIAIIMLSVARIRYPDMRDNFKLCQLCLDDFGKNVFGHYISQQLLDLSGWNYNTNFDNFTDDSTLSSDFYSTQVNYTTTAFIIKGNPAVLSTNIRFYLALRKTVTNYWMLFYISKYKGLDGANVTIFNNLLKELVANIGSFLVKLYREDNRNLLANKK